MRTTLEIDDQLFEQALRKFPPGTPKYVIIREALRAFVEGPVRAPVVFGALNHIPVRILPTFDDPISGFPESNDES